MPILLAIIVLAVIFLLFRWNNGSNATEDRERPLLARCLGNKTQVERLIRFEPNRAPGISREEAIDCAIRTHTQDQ
jgi:hypothetical protein